MTDFQTYLSYQTGSFNKYFLKLLLCDLLGIAFVAISLGRFFQWCPEAIMLRLAFPTNWGELLVPRRFQCSLSVGGVAGVTPGITSTCVFTHWELYRHCINRVMLLLGFLVILSIMQLLSWILMMTNCQKK